MYGAAGTARELGPVIREIELPAAQYPIATNCSSLAIRHMAQHGLSESD